MYLLKGDKHKLAMEEQAQRDAYNMRLKNWSDELVKWCQERDMSVAEFEDMFMFTKKRFEMSFAKVRLKSLTK